MSCDLYTTPDVLISGIPLGNKHMRNQAVNWFRYCWTQHGTEIFFKMNTLNRYIKLSMVTGGMGDRLAGMITSFVGQFDNLKEAVMSATYTHSFIARTLQKMYVVPPSRLINEIPYAMKQLES